MLKRMLAAAVLTGLAVAPVTARAEEISGTVLLPNPAAVALGYGLTEFGSACDPDGPTQGLDGFWVALDGQTQASLVAGANADISDLSLWFYDASCTFMEGIDENALGGDEAGPIPDNAAFVIVDLFVGASAGFTLTLS